MTGVKWIILLAVSTLGKLTLQIVYANQLPVSWLFGAAVHESSHVSRSYIKYPDLYLYLYVIKLCGEDGRFERMPPTMTKQMGDGTNADAQLSIQGF